MDVVLHDAQTLADTEIECGAVAFILPAQLSIVARLIV
jgi:hypothetical protein